jgi:hypothetical protein
VIDRRVNRDGSEGRFDECETPASVHELPFLGRQPIGHPVRMRLKSRLRQLACRQGHS